MLHPAHPAAALFLFLALGSAAHSAPCAERRHEAAVAAERRADAALARALRAIRGRYELDLSGAEVTYLKDPEVNYGTGGIVLLQNSDWSCKFQPVPACSRRAACPEPLECVPFR